MKITLIKQLDNSFKIAYNSDYETAKKIKVGKEYEFEFKQPRNAKFHRKLFALLNLVYQNQEHYNNIEHLRKDLIISAGFYDVRHNLHGQEVIEAKSINFASMKQDEFNELYSRIIDEIVVNFHFDKQDILDSINEYF